LGIVAAAAIAYTDQIEGVVHDGLRAIATRQDGGGYGFVQRRRVRDL
jgi:hypothetical protein